MALRHFNLSTASPCTEAWLSMQGDERIRHCERCVQSVHNLSTMTPKEIERLSLRAAMGEAVCARITRRASDDALVTRPTPAMRSYGGAGLLLSTAMLWGGSAGAQDNKTQPAATAILTGRLMPASAAPGGPRVTFARGVRLVDGSGRITSATVQADGSFSVSAPPGTYDIVAKNNFWHGTTVKAAALHEGIQSMGDVQARELSYSDSEYATVGEVVSIPMRGYWVRHPLAYLRYAGRRIRTKLSQ